MGTSKDPKPTPPQMYKLYETLVEKGVTKALLQDRPLEGGLFADFCEGIAWGRIPDREKFRAFLELDLPLPEFAPLLVDYDEDFASRLAAGKFATVSEGIVARNFRIRGKGLVWFESKAFNMDNIHGRISVHDARRIVEVDDKVNPWYLGEIEHLLAFAKTYRYEQVGFGLICLGSLVWVDKNKYAPYLGSEDSQRHCGHFCRDSLSDGDVYPCHDRLRVLAVRKKISTS